MTKIKNNKMEHPKPYKLSIIIPTYERPTYIARAVSYWMGSDFKVHVLDGSKQPNDVIRARCEGTNIDYHWLPRSVQQRLSKITEHIDTEYTVMCGDDEFLLKSTISTLIEHLDEDPSLGSCCGQSVLFNHTREGIQYKREYASFHQRQSLSPIAEARIESHFRPYAPSTIYAVMRSTIWKYAMARCMVYTFKPYDIEELLFEIIAVTKGRTKCIPELYWLRSQENEPVRNSEGNTLITADWWNDSAYKDDVEKSMRLFDDVTDEHGNVPNDQSYVEKGLSIYSSWWRDKVESDRNPPSPKRFDLIGWILSLMPSRDVDLDGFHSLQDINSVLHKDCEPDQISELSEINKLILTTDPQK